MWLGRIIVNKIPVGAIPPWLPWGLGQARGSAPTIIGIFFHGNLLGKGLWQMIVYKDAATSAKLGILLDSEEFSVMVSDGDGAISAC
jgi:hypothetical protein